MKPADDSTIDYKALVQHGYDLCAAAYHEARMAEVNSGLALFTRRLSDGATVLDIGCGTGVPITWTLAQHFVVTGVDISSEMIRRARVNVPQGNFIHNDIMSVEFPPSSFNGAVAFYSVFHLPREEHSELFRRIFRWLKPGGYLLVTLTLSIEEAYTEDDFFGVTMYWSNHSLDGYKDILTEVRFRILETSVIGHGYSEAHHAPDEQHPLVLAQKE
ncbi:MAG: class I SAM-dependent methyltransferase [Chloroflexi bacterium]|nr:class I SAM-dependent methyltransferase [Chloroflexota bacterium]